MSSALPTPEQIIPWTSPAAATSSSQPWKPRRVLACALCQQRKIKCDRRFPCANCIKSRVQCVPATLVPRQRKRRFPERILLDRLRKYEHMLRQNKIQFEPLHKDSGATKDHANDDGTDHSDEEEPGAMVANAVSPATTVKSEKTYQAKNYWRAMNQGFRDTAGDSDSSYEEVFESSVRKAFDQSFPDTDHLLLGARKTTVDLSTLHPEPVQIFRLWQIYLENVNPLLKVTHAPSLQPRIIEAVSNLKGINSNLEALMFSIYCVSIISLAGDDCQAMFASSKEDLLMGYQFGCQEALFNCEYLRTGNLDCLTALYLYLLSVGPGTDPRSLSSMLGVAIRIARRIGIHSESINTKCTGLEAELRRRVWWSLVLFDIRIGAMANYKSDTLSPIFDCRTLSNVNDSDLRSELREPPVVQGIATEAIFAVVRSEVAEFIRHTSFYLDFTNPALKSVAKDGQQDPGTESSALAPLEKMLEERYLRFCDPDNPLHFMTIWTTRYYIAKYSLLEQYWKNVVSSIPPTDVQRDTTLSTALAMLESDTKILTHPFTKGYRWLFHFYFPFPAYVHTFQDLKRRNKQAERAWEVMSENYEARCTWMTSNDSPLLPLFANFVLEAWQAQEAAYAQTGVRLDPPKIVSHVRSQLAEQAQSRDDPVQAGVVMNMSVDDFSMSMPLDFASPDLLYGMAGQGGFPGTGLTTFPDLRAPISMDVGTNQMNWAGMDWGFSGRRGW